MQAEGCRFESVRLHQCGTILASRAEFASMSQAEYSRRHYEKNRAERIRIVSERRTEIRLRIGEYKQSRGCDRCGYNQCYAALDFHHREPKGDRHSVGRLVERGWSIERIMKEIEDQMLLCKNCHAEKHAGVW